MAWRKLVWMMAGLAVLALAGCGKKEPSADSAQAPSATPAPPGATAPAQQAQALPDAAKPAEPAKADDSTVHDDAFVLGTGDGEPAAPGAAKGKPGAKPAAKPAKEEDPLASFADPSGAASEAQASTAPKPAKASSVSVTPIKDMAGLKGAVARHRGKVVVVNFWATWCPSCVEEFPSLVKLRDSFGSKMALVTVSGDEKGDLDSKVKPFLAKHNARSNAYLAAFGDEAAFASALGWSGQYPLTLIYNRKGERVELIEGAQSYETFADAVRKHL